MTLAKGKSSSHHKGKEITFDDPATKIVGENAPLFESERFEEEEGGRDLDSECAPLIDPWYDTHAHFLKVSDKYFPLLPGHVWLFICYRNIEVSCAPLASSILDLVIRQGTSLPVLILFEFG